MKTSDRIKMNQPSKEASATTNRFPSPKKTQQRIATTAREMLRDLSVEPQLHGQTVHRHLVKIGISWDFMGFNWV